MDSFLRALIFDVDGVVADSEPTHLMAFQQVLGELGFRLSPEEYYANYLGYDDKGCFTAFLVAHGKHTSVDVIDDLVVRKARKYFENIKQHLAIFPGVRELVRKVAPRHRLAVASGALRQEIELILEHAGIRKEFAHISSAEDVEHGKPHPDIFLDALTGLNRLDPSDEAPIRPCDCLVIEDSLPGIRGAKAAGMRVLAVANTHAPAYLDEADAITNSLADICLDELIAKLWKQCVAEKRPLETAHR